MLRTPWPTSEVGYGGRGSQKGLGEGAATLAPRHLHPEHASQTAGYKHRIKRVYALLSNPRKKDVQANKQTELNSFQAKIMRLKRDEVSRDPLGHPTISSLYLLHSVLL